MFLLYIRPFYTLFFFFKHISKADKILLKKIFQISIAKFFTEYFLGVLNLPKRISGSPEKHNLQVIGVTGSIHDIDRKKWIAFGRGEGQRARGRWSVGVNGGLAAILTTAGAAALWEVTVWVVAMVTGLWQVLNNDCYVKNTI